VAVYVDGVDVSSLGEANRLPAEAADDTLAVHSSTQVRQLHIANMNRLFEIHRVVLHRSLEHRSVLDHLVLLLENQRWMRSCSGPAHSARRRWWGVLTQFRVVHQPVKRHLHPRRLLLQ
jgi:hypothetical protein